MASWISKKKVSLFHHLVAVGISGVKKHPLTTAGSAEYPGVIIITWQHNNSMKAGSTSSMRRGSCSLSCCEWADSDRANRSRSVTYLPRLALVSWLISACWAGNGVREMPGVISERDMIVRYRGGGGTACPRGREGANWFFLIKCLTVDREAVQSKCWSSKDVVDNQAGVSLRNVLDLWYTCNSENCQLKMILMTHRYTEGRSKPGGEIKTPGRTDEHSLTVNLNNASRLGGRLYHP